MCIVERQRGQHFRTMGRADREGRMHLLPEETLYLLERGSLDVRWPEEGPWAGLPVSLQAAYAMLAGRDGCSVERYVVYAGLKRMGYVVRRGEGWYGGEIGGERNPGVKGSEKREEQQKSLLGWLLEMVKGTDSGGSKGKMSVVGTGFYRDYSMYSSTAAPTSIADNGSKPPSTVASP